LTAVTVPLSKPVTAHGEEVGELAFREPLTKDVIELGLPTLIVVGDDGGSGVEVRTKVVARYISRLAAVPMSTVEALALKDYNAASAAVIGFFGTGDGEAAPN
jgi:hypothetical protein